MSSWFTRHHSSHSRYGDTETHELDTSTPNQVLSGHPPSPNLNAASSLPNTQPFRTDFRHERSLSHPFPSLFIAKKTRKEKNADATREGSDKSSSSELQESKHLMTQKGYKASSRHENHDFETGNCPTCGSPLRWPKHIQVYRCSACLMVSDLSPVWKRQFFSDTDNKDTLLCRDVGLHHAPRRPSPVSIARTKAIIRQCILTFLKIRVSIVQSEGEPKEAREPRITLKGKGVDYNTPPVRNDEPSLSEQQNILCSQSAPGTYLIRRAAASVASPLPKSLPIVPLSERTEHYSRGEQKNLGYNDGSRKIFAPLEDYLFTCLVDCECLNRSFTAAPRLPARANSDLPSPEKERTEDPDISRYATLSELDAKTLLLGDIGENGFWWTGNRLGSNRRSSNESSPKSPSADKNAVQFDWTAVCAWYDTLVSCGRSWRLYRQSLPPEIRSMLLSRAEERIIDDSISEARRHVQRAFLKMIERLLRRPGRPLNSTIDARFLMILLANPLLYPQDELGSDMGNGPLSLEEKEPTSQHSSYENGDLDYPETLGKGNVSSTSRTAGRHHGIIKRILGLISNLPSECHQSVVSWLCRVPESLFCKMVDLIGGFVTYRLGRQRVRNQVDQDELALGLVPNLSGSGTSTSAQLHAILTSSRTQAKRAVDHTIVYRDDWQVKGAARVMSLLFAANTTGKMMRSSLRWDPNLSNKHTVFAAQRDTQRNAQPIPISAFYNTTLDRADLITDFEVWESRGGKFSFCQFPMFLSIWAKIRILEYDARRQMEVKARDAFFTSILSRKAVSQYLVFQVRRDCLVEDSLRNVSEVVGSGQEEIKKGLRIQFVGEEGIDAGGLRKEWFLLLVRELFDPDYGLFLYDEDSCYCYFNSNSFESSDQFFLVGVILGLAIYNSTILDIALPPFAFRKLLASAPSYTGPATTTVRPHAGYTLEDLAEWRPALARGLRTMLSYEGNVEETFCRDFVADIERYGQIVQVPLCANGERRSVTNDNRREFVSLYVRYVLEIAVARQYEPFKRGFYTVCAGNSLSLFRPEEIELLIRGSDEPLDISSLRAVALYENWGDDTSIDAEGNVVAWFWELFAEAHVDAQRRLLAFITGSDRIPAMGPTSLAIKIMCLGDDSNRYPIARTCFNMLGLYRYSSKQQLSSKIWTAVSDSEGFGFK